LSWGEQGGKLREGKKELVYPPGDEQRGVRTHHAKGTALLTRTGISCPKRRPAQGKLGGTFLKLSGEPDQMRNGRGRAGAGNLKAR